MKKENIDLGFELFSALKRGDKVEWRTRVIGGKAGWSTWNPTGNTAPQFLPTHDYEIRVVKKPIIVNGVEVPYPITKEPKVGSTVYVAHPLVEEGYITVLFSCDATRAFIRGLLHETKEAAIIHSKAMLLRSVLP